MHEKSFITSRTSSRLRSSVPWAFQCSCGYKAGVQAAYRGQGIVESRPATCFPTASALASSALPQTARNVHVWCPTPWSMSRCGARCISPPFLCQRKTGAGNPAPVKRLNLYLSPIETQKSSGDRPCTNSSKRSSSSFAESGSVSDWSEMLPARFITSSST